MKPLIIYEMEFAKKENEKDKKDEKDKKESEKEKKCQEQAKLIYDIVGGRFKLLKKAIATLNMKKSIDQIKVDVIVEARKEYEKLTESPELFKVFNLILSTAPNFQIDGELFAKIIGKDKYKDILKLNVFYYHPENETVGFQSKPMQLYVAQKVEEEKKMVFSKMVI